MVQWSSGGGHWCIPFYYFLFLSVLINWFVFCLLEPKSHVKSMIRTDWGWGQAKDFLVSARSACHACPAVVPELWQSKTCGCIFEYELHMSSGVSGLICNIWLSWFLKRMRLFYKKYDTIVDTSDIPLIKYDTIVDTQYIVTSLRCHSSPRDLLPRGTQTISKSTWIDSLHFLSVVSRPKKVPELYEHEYEYGYYIYCIEF